MGTECHGLHHEGEPRSFGSSGGVLLSLSCATCIARG